jgi:stress response protein SCP2
MLAVASVGWAKTYHMTSMKIVPAAAGEVNVAKEKNGNIQVDVNVTHLAKPDKLTPPANTYVVWFQQEGSQPQRQGQLIIGDDLKGELKSTTTVNHFNVIVTAETDSQTKTPSGEVVLRATVQE